MSFAYINILVVEDSAIFRNQIVEQCRALGMKNIYEEPDGAEAWKFIRDHAPMIDLIVSDIAMPELNGLELLRQVKNMPHTRHLPVIICTSRGTKKTILTSARLKADAFLTKPLDKHKLEKKIGEIMLKRIETPGIAAPPKPTRPVQAAPSPAAEPGRAGCQRIGVICSEKMFDITVGSKLMKQEGLEPLVVKNGIELIDYLIDYADRIKVLLISYTVPVRTGPECVAIIKSSSRFSHIPVCCILPDDSANVEVADEQLWAESSLKRPYREDTLLTEIWRITRTGPFKES